MNFRPDTQDRQDEIALSRYLRPRRYTRGSVLRPVMLACSFVPWLNLIVFLIYAGYVHQGLGHWPKPLVESAPLPYTALLENLSGYTFLALLLSVPLWLIFLFLRLARRETGGVLRSTLLFWLGLGATGLALLLDSGRFFAWWID